MKWLKNWTKNEKESLIPIEIGINIYKSLSEIDSYLLVINLAVLLNTAMTSCFRRLIAMRGNKRMRIVKGTDISCINNRMRMFRLLCVFSSPKYSHNASKYIYTSAYVSKCGVFHIISIPYTTYYILPIYIGDRRGRGMTNIKMFQRNLVLSFSQNKYGCLTWIYDFLCT